MEKKLLPRVNSLFLFVERFRCFLKQFVNNKKKMIFIEFQFNLPLKHGRPLLFSVLLLTILTIRGHQIGLKPLIAKQRHMLRLKMVVLRIQNSKERNNRKKHEIGTI